MVERAGTRCRVRKSPVQTAILGAIGDTCPRSCTPLRDPEPPGSTRRLGSSLIRMPASTVPPSEMMIVERSVAAWNARDVDGMPAGVAEDVDFHPLPPNTAAVVTGSPDGPTRVLAGRDVGMNRPRKVRG